MTLANALSTLETSDLIRLAAVQPELEYLFRHALVQDAAYASLVKADRRALHRAVGEAVERLYPDQLASRELAPVLGRHFALGGDDARALKYFTLAGDATARVYANVEAVMHYSRALDLVKRDDTPVAVSPEQLMHLYLRRGKALELTSQYPEAWRNYEEMGTLARARYDQALELASLSERAKIRSTPTPLHDPAKGQTLSEQALALARELGDREAVCKALWNLMLVNTFTGHPREAVQYGNQSLALARELGLREQLAYTLNDIFRPYLAIGQLDLAKAVIDEARPLWRELDNLPMLADNLGRSARIRFAIGDYARALEFSDEALRLSQSIGNLWGQSFCRMFAGYIYLERGHAAEAIEVMEACIRLGEQAGFMLAQVGTRADLAWIYGVLGSINHGLDLARLARTIAEQRLLSFRPWALASLARLHVMNGNLAEAEAAVKEGYIGLDPEDFASHAGIEMPLAEAELAMARHDYARTLTVMDDLLSRLRKTGTRLFLTDALLLKSQALLALGQANEAHETGRMAQAEAVALGSRRALWPILAVLSQLEAQRGHHAEVQALRQQAREIILYMADHCPPDLRASFLNRPDARAVLEAT
jgi:tetratricopeptide (TPR) repeat protein